MPHLEGQEQIIGERYALYGSIAEGGMATVHFGRLLGSVGFSRGVAIKRLRGEFLATAEMVSTLLDEARLAARVRHPNVVGILDMVQADGEVFLVMEYVPGESLARLLRAARQTRERPPVAVVVGVMCGVLHGLHAAHEATDESGEPLGIVHRDVSPQNVLVGVDGLARLLDFGIAKGKGRLQTTRAGQLKGKVSYMAPEQILGEEPDRRTDVYAASVVLWEALAGRRLYPAGKTPAGNVRLMPKILEADIDPPGAHVDGLPRGLDAVVMRGLNRDPSMRYQSARTLAVALEQTVPLATQRQVGEWVEDLAAFELARRAEVLRQIEAAAPPAGRSQAAAAVAAAIDHQRRAQSERDEGRRPARGGEHTPTVRESATGESVPGGPLAGAATDIDSGPPISGVGGRAARAPAAGAQVAAGQQIDLAQRRPRLDDLPPEERTAVSPAPSKARAGGERAQDESASAVQVRVISSPPAGPSEPPARSGDSGPRPSPDAAPASPPAAARPASGRPPAPSSRPIPSLVPASLGRDDIELPVGSRLGWVLLVIVLVAAAVAAAWLR